MASIHRQPKSPYWYAAFTNADGRRSFKSTGTPDRRKATQMALKFEESARLGKGRRLTEQRAREVIAEIYAIANQDKLSVGTVAEYMKT